LGLVEQAGQTLPEHIRQAARLSDYAVEARYPGFAEPVSQEEYEEAISIAVSVLNWAQEIVQKCLASK